MKNFALVIAFALLAAVPASAAEISKSAPAAPAVTLEHPAQGPAPLFLGILQITPRCYTLQGTSCPTDGATTACTDSCSYGLSCTCYNYYGGPYNQTIIGRYWLCMEEC
jgi:hypothetical protein